MKFIVIVFIINIFCLKIFGQNGNCKIKCEVNDKNFVEKIYLLKGDKPHIKNDEIEIVDSIISRKGKFEFNFSTSYTDFYSIRLKKSGEGFVIICSPNSQIDIKCDTSNLYEPKFINSSENKLRELYKVKLIPLITKMNNYADSANLFLMDSTLYKKYVALNIFSAKEIRDYNLGFINNNPNCLTSLKMYNRYFNLFTKKAVRSYLKHLPAVLKKNPIANNIYLKKIKEFSEDNRSIEFYDFNFVDTSGKAFDFKNYYNSIVVIDFWASWCKPCIENIKNLDTLYQKYNHLKVKFLSVSIDKNLSIWKKGIALTLVSWENISDLKGIDGPTIRFYKIEAIPRCMILNGDGSMISNDVSLFDLEKIILENISKIKTR